MRGKIYDYRCKEDLEFWYERTHSGVIMAEIFYCSPKTIYKWLHIHGVELEAVHARRKPHLIVINGYAHTLAEWEQKTGTKSETIKKRLQRGYKGDELLWGRRKRKE